MGGWIGNLFHKAECAVWSTNLYFWEAVKAVQVAKATGAITSVDQCKQLAAQGDSVFGTSGIAASGGGCVCEYVFGNGSGAVPPPVPFSTRIVDTGTTFDPETDGTWLMVHRDGSTPDLAFIKTSNVASGKVEVHIASGASNY